MIVVLDTETTGRTPAEVIELAWVTITEGVWTKAAIYKHQHYKPEVGSCFGALATHHIHDDELVNYPPSKEARIPADITYIIGHNIDYDWEVLGKPEHVKRICTLAMARALHPELDSHKLGALAYAFSKNYSSTRQQLKGAHTAAADVELCYGILVELIDKAKAKGETLKTAEDLWNFSERCRVPTIMSFGKHKGLPIKDLPRDYISWCLRQPDFDPYVIKAMKGVGK